MDPRHLTRIRWAVRAVLTVGVLVSVTANVLHARHHPVSQAIAGWPPIALLLTVELISRVPVHHRGLAIARILATTCIAAIAGWVSYWHMAGVAAHYGETGTSAYLFPLSVDGLIVVSSICLVELSPHARDKQRIKVAPAGEEPKLGQAEITVAALTHGDDRLDAPSDIGPQSRLSETRAQGHSGTSTPSRQDVAHDHASPWPSTTVAVYAPTSEEDIVMYAAWLSAQANGRRASGADLARAAGRNDDNAGVGRRAARRYRDAHLPGKDSGDLAAPSSETQDSRTPSLL